MRVRIKCIRTRTYHGLKEHFNFVGGTPSGQLSVDSERYGCAALKDQVIMEARYEDKTARELQEAFLITKEGDACASVSALALRGSSVLFWTCSLVNGSFAPFPQEQPPELRRRPFGETPLPREHEFPRNTRLPIAFSTFHLPRSLQKRESVLSDVLETSVRR